MIPRERTERWVLKVLTTDKKSQAFYVATITPKDKESNPRKDFSSSRLAARTRPLVFIASCNTSPSFPPRFLIFFFFCASWIVKFTSLYEVLFSFPRVFWIAPTTVIFPREPSSLGERILRDKKPFSFRIRVIHELVIKDKNRNVFLQVNPSSHLRLRNRHIYPWEQAPNILDFSNQYFWPRSCLIWDLFFSIVLFCFVCLFTWRHSYHWEEKSGACDFPPVGTRREKLGIKRLSTQQNDVLVFC